MKRYWYITPEDYEIAKKNGIKRGTVNDRVRKWGWDVDRAITEVPKRHHIPAELLEEAEKIGLEYNTIACRLYQGWDMKEACTKPKKQGRQRVHPDWVYELAKKNGISYPTVYCRVRTGWDLLRACTEEVWDKKKVTNKMKESKKSN